jgi:hypothetical protein
MGHHTDSGRHLNELWKVNARHALYSKDGHWYMPLERFPGALFDPNGYVVFRTEEEYLNCGFLTIGERLHVTDGISRIPEYRKVR